MKGKSVAKIIGKTFGKTFCVLVVMIGVGVLSYYLTQLYYTTTKRSERCNTYEHVIDVKAGVDSSNLIYAYNKENNKVTAIVLELYGEDTHNLDYVTIPAATEVEMPSEMYIDMLKVSKEIPQIARLSDIQKYFSGDVAFEYGILLLEEAMGVEIGYFTTIPSDMFQTYFTNIGTKGSPKYTPSNELFTKVGGTDEKAISDFMESTWDKIISDITLSKRQRYAAGFAKVDAKLIHSHRVDTEVRINGSIKTHIINKEAAEKLIDGLMERGPYKKAQKKSSNKVISSKGKNIWVTNGSKITGLAKSYQEKLGLEGFTVKGIGDYTGDIQTTTTILVKKANWGKDLLTYFPGAEIQKSSALKEDADIEIILGINAKQTES